MTMTSPDSFHAPPPSSRRIPESAGSTFFHDSLHDLAVQNEWLEQVLDGVPEPQASSDACAMLRGWAKTLAQLQASVAHFQQHARDKRFARLFAAGAPLTAYLARLYAWCAQLTVDFEAVAAKLRRNEPILGLLRQKDVNDSFAIFQELGEPLRESFVESRPMTLESQAAWRGFDEDLEELIWATEWMHMNLARSPGDHRVG